MRCSGVIIVRLSVVQVGTTMPALRLHPRPDRHPLPSSLPPDEQSQTAKRRNSRVARNQPVDRGISLPYRGHPVPDPSQGDATACLPMIAAPSASVLPSCSVVHFACPPACTCSSRVFIWSRTRSSIPQKPHGAEYARPDGCENRRRSLTQRTASSASPRNCFVAGPSLAISKTPRRLTSQISFSTAATAGVSSP